MSDLFEDLYEASKRDDEIIAGSDIRQIIGTSRSLYAALVAALGWIDAVPKSIELPTMPGFDRDDVADLLAKARGEHAADVDAGGRAS